MSGSEKAPKSSTLDVWVLNSISGILIWILYIHSTSRTGGLQEVPSNEKTLWLVGTESRDPIVYLGQK